MHFSHDELYQDRTWFDELGARLMRQCKRCLPHNRAQLWTSGFALFAALCVAWAAGLATHCVLFDLAPNQCLAQLLAAGLLLVAARHFLAVTGLSAAGALPRRKLVYRTQPAPHRAASRQSLSAAAEGRMGASVPVPPPESRSAVDPKQFFRAVKDAGINVRIARALYAAGFRSGEQVRACDDARLLAIPGIGQATLRKLRLQFGLPRSESRPQSNAA